PARITKCLTTLARDIGNLLGPSPDEFRSIAELISRAEKLDAENLQSQLASVLVRKITDSSGKMAADWFDALFFHNAKSPKKWSLIAEVADRSAYPHPANHEQTQGWMNARFQSVDEPNPEPREENMPMGDAFANPANRLDGSFPSVRLPVLGNVILRSMS